MDDGSDHRPRQSLDELVAAMGDPRFVPSHRRTLSFRETSRHVNPLMLAGAPADSVYVRQWRRHAAECPPCRRLFEYFDLPLED